MPRLFKHDAPSNDTAELGSLYVLGTLNELDRCEFERHLEEGCAVCVEEISRAGATLQALAETANQNLPSGMRERFLERVQSEQSLKAKSNGPGALLLKSGLLIARTESMEWQAGPVPGIWVKQLFVDRGEKSATSLVRMDAGSRYPSHRHNGPEEVFLLNGDLTVEGLRLQPGDYCNAQPSSIHQESRTEDGCLFILRACELDEALF